MSNTAMNTTGYAPIALFTYSRADHTRDAVESLLRNKESAESDLFIFSDGPKTEEKRSAVEENRRYIHTIKGFKSIHIVEHEANQGLAKSLIAGITEVVNQYGRVIVVEDDLILSPYFLQFMNDALVKYTNEERVGAVTAYCPVKGVELPDTYFLRYFHCWGWGTWKRGWDLLNTDTKYLLRKLRWKKSQFDMDGRLGTYGMLYCQKVGLVDSWYIRFYASLFLAERLILFPGKSLVSNHGLDGSGTHGIEHRSQSGDDGMTIFSAPINLTDILIKENEAVYRVFYDKLLISAPKTPRLAQIYQSFKSFVRRLLYIDSL